MAKRSNQCNEKLHGYGVYWLNGQRFTEATYTGSDALALVRDALKEYDKLYGYEVRPLHYEAGIGYRICNGI